MNSNIGKILNGHLSFVKKVLQLLLLTAALSGFAQSNNPYPVTDCGTRPGPNYKKWHKNIIQNNVSNLMHDQCLNNKKFSIVFYVIADSMGGMGGITQSSLNGCIANLNSKFSRICISFMNCSTVVVPHHPYNRWTDDSVHAAVMSMYWTENTINFYLPDSIVGPAAGYAPLGASIGSEFVVVEKGSIGGMTPIHEMGHFFGLPHTWDEVGATPAQLSPPAGVGSMEYVRRDSPLANCYDNGDLFCDTDADCYPVNYVPGPSPPPPPCKQQPGAKDAYGNYYIPPVDNYMTYFGCRCKFSQEQYNFMALTILAQLMHLH